MWILEVCLAYTIGLGCTASRAEVFPDIQRCFEELQRETKDSAQFMPRGMTVGRCTKYEEPREEKPKHKMRRAA